MSVWHFCLFSDPGLFACSWPILRVTGILYCKAASNYYLSTCLSWKYNKSCELRIPESFSNTKQGNVLQHRDGCLTATSSIFHHISISTMHMSFRPLTLSFLYPYVPHIDSTIIQQWYHRGIAGWVRCAVPALVGGRCPKCPD